MILNPSELTGVFLFPQVYHITNSEGTEIEPEHFSFLMFHISFFQSSRSDAKVTDVKDVRHSLNKIVLRNVRFKTPVFLSILKAF